MGRVAGRSIFVRRHGAATMRVVVIDARPRAAATARGMRRHGLPLYFIAWRLAMRRERVDRIAGALAFFKY